MTFKSWVANPLHLIRTRYALSYLTMNLTFYGVIMLAMFVVSWQQAIQHILTQSVQGGLQSPTWSFVVNAYGGQHIVRAAFMTFAVNFMLGTLIEIGLPSMLMPFIGIGIGLFRAALWGFIFGPGENGYFHVLKTHWPVMVLEGQGYVLGMLSVYIHGKGLIKPTSVGATSHGQGYRRGFQEAVRFYPLIALVLGLSAIYEAIEVILFLHK